MQTEISAFIDGTIFQYIHERHIREFRSHGPDSAECTDMYRHVLVQGVLLSKILCLISCFVNQSNLNLSASLPEIQPVYMDSPKSMTRGRGAIAYFVWLGTGMCLPTSSHAASDALGSRGRRRTPKGVILDLNRCLVGRLSCLGLPLDRPSSDPPVRFA